MSVEIADQSDNIIVVSSEEEKDNSESNAPVKRSLKNKSSAKRRMNK
jgi:hypothetical protein